MKIVIELTLPDGTRLDGVQQAQLRCAVGKIIDALKAQGIDCEQYGLTYKQD